MDTCSIASFVDSLGGSTTITFLFICSSGTPEIPGNKEYLHYKKYTHKLRSLVLIFLFCTAMQNFRVGWSIARTMIGKLDSLTNL